VTVIAQIKDMAKNAPLVNIDLSNARAVGVLSQNDLVDMLRSGEVVVIDKKTGQYLTELMGVPLPPVERVIETVIAKRAGKIM
jgi:hypothetical protein